MKGGGPVGMIFGRAFSLFSGKEAKRMVRDADTVLYRRGVTTTPPKEEERWLTREEAVVWLLAWRDEFVPKYNLDFSPRMNRAITSGLEAVYMNGLIDELIERVRNGTEDPITEVAMYYYEMDEILATSDDDHYITHRFASFMEDKAHSVLTYLQKKEREMWENEHERLLRKSACRC